jgi:hypothetical protein
MKPLIEIETINFVNVATGIRWYKYKCKVCNEYITREEIEPHRLNHYLAEIAASLGKEVA